MRTQILAKLKKLLLMVLRKTAKPLVHKLRLAKLVYYWSDLHLFGLDRVYLLPICAYRFLTWFCNRIVNFNTRDHRNLRCKWLQRAVNWLIHRIPIDIRFA